MSQQIVCRICKQDWEVSEEDPDATMGDALDHVIGWHGESDDDAVHQLKVVG